MRKIAYAPVFAVVSAISFTAPASAQYNPYDPGCSTSVGGNCGKQLDSWNNTWRRLHYPLEPGQGAHGTYLPDGRYVPQQRRFIGLTRGLGEIMRRGMRTVIERRHRHEEHREVRAGLVSPRQSMPARITQAERALLNSVYK